MLDKHWEIVVCTEGGKTFDAIIKKEHIVACNRLSYKERKLNVLAAFKLCSFPDRNIYGNLPIYVINLDF